MMRVILALAITLVGGAVTVALLILGFYAEEDWRGAHDWAQLQQRLADRGELLDLRQLAPPGRPGDDLSKTPIFAPLYLKDVPPDAPIRRINPYLKSDYPPVGPKYSSYKNRKPLDLAAWQTYYRSLPDAGLAASTGTPAQDVLQVLGRFDGDIRQVDTCVSNPNAFLPVDYERPYLTSFGSSTVMIRIAQTLSLRAVAYLDNNQADLAEKDYLLSFRLNQPLLKRCFMVDYLVAVGVRAIDESILWEGLHRHAWSEGQLREMEAALASPDILGAGANCLRMERGFGLATEKMVRKNFRLHYDLEAGFSDKASLAETENILFLELRPSGWADQESIFQVNYTQKRIDAIRVSEGLLDSESFNEEKKQPEASIWEKLNFMVSKTSMDSLYSVDHVGLAIARAESYRRLARLSCRLEEYRLAHGQYPDKLENLADLPAHLNQEVLGVDPLRYARNGDGYLLYSVGWNQRDDGGVTTKDDTQGDWVWPSP